MSAYYRIYKFESKTIRRIKITDKKKKLSNKYFSLDLSSFFLTLVSKISSYLFDEYMNSIHVRKSKEIFLTSAFVVHAKTLFFLSISNDIFTKRKIVLLLYLVFSSSIEMVPFFVRSFILRINVTTIDFENSFNFVRKRIVASFPFITSRIPKELTELMKI